MDTKRVRARRLLLAAVALTAMSFAFGAVASASPRAVVVVKTMKNAKLGKTVLVTRKGRTLYHLSVERRGHFICVGSCLSFWHPLIVPRGTRPAGAAGLSVVRRPDGRLQVAFRGGPLYTFAGDKKPGDANGEGFKDVGVWHAASLQRSAAPPPSTTPTIPYP